MKKFNRIDNLYSLAESPPPSLHRTGDQKFLYSSLNSSDYYLKSGLSAINDKKWSILQVPKNLPNKIPETRQAYHKNFQNQNTYNLNPPVSFTPKPALCLPNETKLSSACKSARLAILNSNRYRQNPNKENLKLALEEISKLPPILKEEKKREIKRDSPQKSDIEALIESQNSGRAARSAANTTINSLSSAQRKLIKPKHLQIKIDQSCKPDDASSQKSDPSPVRIKPSSPARRGKSQKFLSSNKKTQNILSLLKKIQNPIESKTLASVSSSSSSLSSPTIPKNFDYKQESLRILKNTSTFATKIMKNIRLARKKDF